MMEPQPEYESRRSAWLAKQTVLQRELIRLGNARLALAALAMVLIYFAYVANTLAVWWLAIPLIALLALFAQHARVSRNRAFAERGLRYYDRALQRLNNKWQGNGEPGELFAMPTTSIRKTLTSSVKAASLNSYAPLALLPVKMLSPSGCFILLRCKRAPRASKRFENLVRALNCAKTLRSWVRTSAPKYKRAS